MPTSGTAWGTNGHGRLVPVEVRRTGSGFFFSGAVGEYRALGLGFGAAVRGAGDWLGLDDLRLVLSRLRLADAGGATFVPQDLRARDRGRAQRP